MNFGIIFLITFFVSYSSTPFLRALAVRCNILDHPGHRKIHKEATPFLGGVAIYFGLVLGLLCNLDEFYLFLPLLMGATVILAVGLLDDLRGLSARYRLLCHFLVSLIVIASGVRINFLPHTLWGNIAEVVITIFWT
jgi:UDP-GlcNAc:undecaprenyl-phosphate GlcNAc-1-phosphate transferase